MKWEPTRHGGLRRTGVAQMRQERRSDEAEAGGPHPSPGTRWAFRLAEKLGLPECPYVIRWRLETPWGSIRIHRWLASDDDRAFHDHPWWFTTLILKGGYTDRNPAGSDHLHAGSLRIRRAMHRHTVIPDPGGAWTLVVTGRKVRRWGFWPGGKFVKANKWFLAHGHHPCK